MARQLRKSTRRVRRYHRYGSKTLYVHDHGELRSNTQPLAFQVPHGVYICICTGPGVAITERLGKKMMRNEPIAINTPLAWMDRPGQPVHLIREQSRTHNMYYPMYCPNYTLLPPDDLQICLIARMSFRPIRPYPLKASCIEISPNSILLSGPIARSFEAPMVL
jgi:hypothetical protein